MRTKLLLLMVAASAAAAFAQPAVTAPGVGTVRDVAGGLHPIIGIPGNFVVLDDLGISNVVSAAFSGAAGMVKSDTQLLIFDSTNQVTKTYDMPGRALLAFDRDGVPALVFCSGTLFRFENQQLTALNWTGEPLSIAMTGSQSAAAIVKHDDRLWKVNISLPAGDAENETLLGDIAGPVILLPGGDFLFTRDGNIVVRDAQGVERAIPAGFDVDYFEPMGRDWIAFRESGQGRLFVLRITAQSLELYQIPEVTQ